MEQTGTTEKNYRINMKQTAKGHWSAEFSVRADSLEELKQVFTNAKNIATEEVKYLNAKEALKKGNKNQDPLTEPTDPPN